MQHPYRPEPMIEYQTANALTGFRLAIAAILLLTTYQCVELHAMNEELNDVHGFICKDR